MSSDGTAVDLDVLREELLERARGATARRAAATVFGGRNAVMRQTMLVLLADTELPEHDSPLEATLQVLTGRIRLVAGARWWDLAAREHLTIPPERHSVVALEDSSFLLTAVTRTP